jgi:hypothetical protein
MTQWTDFNEARVETQFSQVFSRIACGRCSGAGLLIADGALELVHSDHAPLEVLQRGATAGRRKTGHCKVGDPPCRAIGCAHSNARCRPFHPVMSEGMSPYEIYYVLATDKEIQRLTD